MLKVLLFNIQGYYDPKKWLAMDYGFIGKLFSIVPHPRRMSHANWLKQDKVKELFQDKDLMLLQETCPHLISLITHHFKNLHSIRANHSVHKMHHRGRHYTTDILYNFHKLKVLDIQTAGAYPESTWPDCHQGLIVKFQNKETNEIFHVIDGHLEAGISLKAKLLREKLLSDLMQIQTKFKKVFIGMDSNDLIKKGTKSHIRKILKENNFKEYIKGRRTYYLDRHEIPGLEFVSKLLNINDSIDKLASRNIEIENLLIHEIPGSVSDHKPISFEIN